MTQSDLALSLWQDTPSDSMALRTMQNPLCAQTIPLQPSGASSPCVKGGTEDTKPVHTTYIWVLVGILMMIVALVPILGHRLAQKGFDLFREHNTMESGTHFVGGGAATLSGYLRKREYHFRKSGSYPKQNNDSKH